MPSPVRPTTIVHAPRLAERLGVDLVIATETFQQTGSFKFRAAYNLASKVPQGHIVTASSGNFGQAIAYACKLLGKQCHVVMPATSARTKIEAVREFGGTVDLIDVNTISRAERVQQLADQYPDAYVASAYDDDLVIEGNSSLAHDLVATGLDFDAVIAPVGGGGLTAGLVKGYHELGKAIQIYGAEPALANDAAQSLRAGHIISNPNEPQTIADGARTVSVGIHNWQWLEKGLAGIFEVPEDDIREGVRKLFLFANLKSEPTGALSIGALLQPRPELQGKKVCCVISGGNVDPSVYAEILQSIS
jgi:threonine dehydratase